MGDAADAPPPMVAVWVDYRAPGDCPDRSLLMERIAERNARLYESSEAPPVRRYSVVISASDDGFDGRLEQPETRAVRDVSGTDCARVLDALALVVALSAESSEGPREVEPVPVELRDAEPAPVTRPRAAETAPRTSVISSSEPDRPVDAPSVGSRHAAWLLGTGGVALVGLASDWLAGPVAGFEWTHDDGWLSLRGSGRWAFGLDGSGATSTWQLVPELCGWMPIGSIELSGCGGLSFGRVIDPSATWTWVAPLFGVGLRAPLVEGWGFGFGSYAELRGEIDFPVDSRSRPVSTGRPALDAPSAVFGATLLVGFGPRLRPGIKTATAGHPGK